MRVALGTLEIDDDQRKKIGKAVTGSSYFKRDQAKEWALGIIQAEIDRLTNTEPVAAPAPVTAPKDAEALPEPAAPTLF